MSGVNSYFVDLNDLDDSIAAKVEFQTFDLNKFISELLLTVGGII